MSSALSTDIVNGFGELVFQHSEVDNSDAIYTLLRPLTNSAMNSHLSFIVDWRKRNYISGDQALLKSNHLEQGHIESLNEIFDDFEENSADSTNAIRGYTALLYAAMMGYTSTVRILIEFGADVNIRGADGYTPLLLSCAFGHIKIVKQLLEAGANLMDVNYSGNSALLLASTGGHFDIIKYLTEADFDPNSENKQNHITALKVASTQRVRDYLIFKGAV